MKVGPAEYVAMATSIGPRLGMGHRTWAEANLSVRTKQGLIVPFRLQPAQVKLSELIDSQRARGKPVRIISLKARQVMVSTATAAQFFQRIAFSAGQRAMVVAHEEKAAKNIFGYYSVFDESFSGTDALGKASATRDARIGGIIEYEGGSYVHVLTANNLKGGRSFSLRFLHLSEYAFWRNARTLMTGLMQCVPDDPDTMVIKESTANGVGGPFHQDWLEACAGGSEWEPMFFGWWEHPEYSRPIAYPDQFQASLSPEEKELARLYNLTLEQLHWRRWCIKNNCQSSVSIFHQEYPSNPEEAFISSGRPRFFLPALARMPMIREASVGELEEIRNGPKRVIAFLPTGDGGSVTIYRPPAEGQQYVIGVDIAEGIDINEATLGNPDPDYTVMHVANRQGEQVAKLRARIEPSPAGEYAALLGAYYNWAFIVPEANGPGLAFIDSLLRADYPPALIFHRKPQPDELEVDGRAATTSRYLGWKNNVVTRVQLISAHDQAIRELAICFHDPNTVSEHQTFVIKPNSKAEHNEGCHDDEVIAAALATQGLLSPPPDRLKMGLVAPHPQGLARSGSVQRYGNRQPEQRGRLFHP